MADVVEIDALTGEVVERAFTVAELAQRAADDAAESEQEAILATLHTNRDTLEQQAQAALEQNRIAIAADPAAVTLAQVAGQVQALSAQNNALIRLVLGLLDSTN
jgi:phenylpropionate dioxygenase-like ring-hydroxylating dioxygenase large terminal subunit